MPHPSGLREPIPIGLKPSEPVAANALAPVMVARGGTLPRALVAASTYS